MFSNIKVKEEYLHVLHKLGANKEKNVEKGLWHAPESGNIPRLFLKAFVTEINVPIFQVPVLFGL